MTTLERCGQRSIGHLCAAGPLRSGRVRAGLLLTHAAVDRKAAVLAANELATGACSDLPPAVFGIGILARLANTCISYSLLQPFIEISHHHVSRHHRCLVEMLPMGNENSRVWEVLGADNLGSSLVHLVFQRYPGPRKRSCTLRRGTSEGRPVAGTSW